MPYRILLTGSRAWPYANTVKQALISEIACNKARGKFILVHGGCPTGADFQAGIIWEWFQKADTPLDIRDPEVYPAGKYGTFKNRNQLMVDLGADVVLAFADSWASGTGQTARMARKAGMRVRDYGVDTK